MSHRKNGETLAISDSVAMMPTVQPAAAGTHEYREALRVKVTVIGREDIRSSREIVVMRARGDRGNVYQTGPVYFSPGPWPGSSGAALAFTERQLQRLQPVAHRPGMRSEVLGGGGDQPGQRGDQPARLVEIAACGLSSGSSDDSPSFSAAALISITADRVITSTAGISASSRTDG